MLRPPSAAHGRLRESLTTLTELLVRLDLLARGHRREASAVPVTSTGRLAGPHVRRHRVHACSHGRRVHAAYVHARSIRTRACLVVSTDNKASIHKLLIRSPGPRPR